MPDTPASTYAQRLNDATELRNQAHRRWSLLGNVRLLAAIVTIVGLWQLWDNASTAWTLVTLVGLMAFIVLAVQQRSAGLIRNKHEARITVNQRAIARLNHTWDELPTPPESGADRTHHYAHDLNIVGPASVAQRIGTPATSHGWKALYAALLTDRNLSDLDDRQKAIAEVAPKLDLRQDVEAVNFAGESIPDATVLLEWSRQPDWLKNRQWLRWIALIGPGLVILCAILFALGIIPWAVILLPVTLNTLVFVAAGSQAAMRVQEVAPMRDAISGYGQIMARISTDAPATPMLQDLATRLSGAASAMRVLARTANFSMPPGSMLYFPLQMAFLWDVNVLDRLENWREAHGRDVHGWLDAMGEWEALAALSVFTHDNPGWAMPAIDSDAQGLSAEAMAHPLLHESIAVPNDVEVGPAGTFLFVTGSNMSGKSTLLRAIGANAVLAQAGASVCAAKMTMPPLRISSCMRVEDSLAHGVSFFMAELLRLKSVIDLVQQSEDRMALYLLDEILQGTNTAERQIASRHVLQQLTGMNAIGAVSSHDLELIDDTSLEEEAISVHFAEQFTRENGKPDMTFDYHLRPGLATSSNAIRLMELIGFELPD